VGTLAPEQVTLLTDYDIDSAYSMAYHTVYNNLRLNWGNAQTKPYAVLLASPAAYTGRAAAPTNVAIAAAQSGTPTLLVDADLHTPGIQQRFGMGEHSGLSELLREEVITVQTLSSHISKTFIPDLYLLSAGAALHQPYEISRLFATKLATVVAALRQFLHETAGRPGMIIFHSPPVLTGSDASLISACVDQTFLLIASGRTTRTQARKAQEQFQRAHAILAGVILLDV